MILYILDGWTPAGVRVKTHTHMARDAHVNKIGGMGGGLVGKRARTNELSDPIINHRQQEACTTTTTTKYAHTTGVRESKNDDV